MEGQNILIDQLEDKLIDNPVNGNSFNDVDLDKSFQNQLNEGATQLGHETWADSASDGADADLSSYDFLFSKPKLEFIASDMSSLYDELCQWFTTSDFKDLQLYTLHTKPTFDLNTSLKSVDLNQPSECLQSLTYFCLGNYSPDLSEEMQLHEIQKNCRLVLSHETIVEVIYLLKKCFDSCIDACNDESYGPISAIFDRNFLQVMTILYFCLNSALQSNTELELALKALSQHQLSSTITRLCESWGAQHNSKVRIRYSLLLLWKLLLFEFGGAARIKEADRHLISKYQIKNKERTQAPNKELVCSKLDYFTYKEDIHDKYPLTKHTEANFKRKPEAFNTETGQADITDHLSLHQESFMAINDFSGSLSNSMNNPRTNKVHSVYSNLPTQAVHIATPIPSPPSTPSEFMSGGEKVRKLYHVNQGMPIIYPYDSDQLVPEAIKEAEDLLEQSVYESYSMKRLFRERELFMKQERGTSKEVGDVSEDTALKNENLAEENTENTHIINSLKRVEDFYANSLPHLRGFVHVLVGVVKSSKIEVSLRNIECELDPQLSFSKKYGADKSTSDTINGLIFSQLETLRVKEITLKAVSCILVLLLKWFKLSHIMKQRYLSSLLFDANYFNVFVDFLADSFNNSFLHNTARENKNIQMYDVLSSQNRLMNPMINLAGSTFFKFCRKCADTSCEGMKLVKKDPLTRISYATDGNNQNVISGLMYNTDFCVILTNLLNVTNKVLIKNISQRILVFNETKSTDLLKLVLLNYINDELRMPILKIFKKLTPCQGRKWRSVNMDVISLIYLHLKLSLRDNWLSGKDIESEFNSSYEQEVSLRSLLQFYHMRKYPHSMAYLGYSLQTRSWQ